MTLTPLVYWAQRHGEVYLRVELTDAQVSTFHNHYWNCHVLNTSSQVKIKRNGISKVN